MRIGMRDTRPFGDAVLRDLRIEILSGHDLRLAPAPVERIGKSEILPHLGGIFSRTDELSEDFDARFGVAGQRQRQTVIARRNAVLVFLQQRLRGVGAALRDVHQRQADHRARARIAQRQRIVERLAGGGEASIGEIGLGERLAEFGIARIERDGGFGLFERLVGLARGQRLLRGRGQALRTASARVRRAAHQHAADQDGRCCQLERHRPVDLSSACHSPVPFSSAPTCLPSPSKRC